MTAADIARISSQLQAVSLGSAQNAPQTSFAKALTAHREVEAKIVEGQAQTLIDSLVRATRTEQETVRKIHEANDRSARIAREHAKLTRALERATEALVPAQRLRIVRELQTWPRVASVPTGVLHLHRATAPPAPWPDVELVSRSEPDHWTLNLDEYLFATFNSGADGLRTRRANGKARLWFRRWRREASAAWRLGLPIRALVAILERGPRRRQVAICVLEPADVGLDFSSFIQRLADTIFPGAPNHTRPDRQSVFRGGEFALHLGDLPASLSSRRWAHAPSDIRSRQFRVHPPDRAGRGLLARPRRGALGPVPDCRDSARRLAAARCEPSGPLERITGYEPGMFELRLNMAGTPGPARRLICVRERRRILIARGLEKRRRRLPAGEIEIAAREIRAYREARADDARRKGKARKRRRGS